MHLVVFNTLDAHGLEGASPDVQGHEGALDAFVRQRLQQRLVKMQPCSRCGHRAGTLGVHRLVTLAVTALIGTVDIGWQRHMPDTLKQTQHRLGKGQLEQSVMPGQHARLSGTVDVDQASRLGGLARAHMRQHAAIAGRRHGFGIAALMLAMLGMAIFASFASFWPYNLTPSLRHYVLGLVDGEVGEGFVNSLKMAAGTAFFGTLLVFFGAYLLEKTKGAPLLRGPVRMLAMLPMAVPGLVLGLGYIFFFNAPNNPLHGLYQTTALLTLCTIIHFYTTGHLTAVTALKSLDSEFEAVSASLKVPWFRTFWRVTLPICTPAMVDIARYFFVNAMTTISAVVFLYSPDTKVASIAILNLDEAGEIGAAAAMAVMIAAISAVSTGVFMLLARWVDRRTQAWRGGR